jgi:ABC-2 type transport system permease protein
MSKLWLVALKELRMTAHTKAYLITTLTGPFIIVALFTVPELLAQSALDSASVEGRTVAFVGAGELLPAIRAEFAPLGVVVEEAGEEAPLADRVRDGGLHGYVVFPADVLDGEDPRYVSDDVVDITVGLLSGAIGRAVVQRRLERAGMDADRITTLTRPPRLQALVLEEEGSVEQDTEASLTVVLAFLTLLYVMLMLYGQALGRSVLTEKTGKTVEIMLSSLHPFALLAGKVLGKGVAGVLQYLAWMLIALVAIEVLGPVVDVSVPPFVQPGNLLSLLCFFSLGFLLYSSAFAMAGAIAADEQNFSQLLLPVMVALVVPMLLLSSVLLSPDGTLAVVLSLIPLTAPVVMFTRVLVGDPGALQVVVAVAGMVLVTVAAVWAAAKVFRLGILLTGKKGTFGEVVRLLRA